MTATPQFTGRAALAKARPIGRWSDLHHRGRFSTPTPSINFPGRIVATGNQPDLSKPFSGRRGNSATCGRERGTPRSNDPRGIGRAGEQTTPAPLAKDTEGE